MKPLLTRTIAALSIALSALAFAEPDRKGCTDHPLFPTRMPDFFIVDCKSSEFDGYDFFVAKGPKNHQEGRFTFITYQLAQGKPDASGIAVVRNYQPRWRISAARSPPATRSAG